MSKIVAKEKQGVFSYPREGSSLKIRASDQYEGDLLVIGIWDISKASDQANGSSDGAVSGTKRTIEGLKETFGEDVAKMAQEVMEEDEIDGKVGSTSSVIRLGKDNSIKRMMIYGLGKKKDNKEMKEVIEKKDGCLKSVKSMIGSGFDKEKLMTGNAAIGFWIEEGWDSEWIQGAAECCFVGEYNDKRFKGDSGEAKGGDKDKKKKIKEVVFVGAKETDSKAIERAKAVAVGVVTTKELIAAPANVLTPESMAECAKKVAEEEGLEIKILEKEDCEKLGMGSYLAVNQGSTVPVKFIHMTYKPSGTVKKKVVFVGKTVCHDTGGYNLKAGAGSMIASMKFDMGGGGTTLGAAKAIGKLKPENVEAHFIMPACENMISGTAIHPGDVVTASNGKTIEIYNTDAEGRLTLADALVYAEKLGDVDYIFDIATLTGACIVALGNDVAGMWTNDDEFAKIVESIAKKNDDKLWRMPLPEEYQEQIKSKIADLKNTGGRAGGSITAALFLKHFVKKAKWMHLDIAGTAWSEKKGGATGWGVRTFVDFVETMSKEA